MQSSLDRGYAICGGPVPELSCTVVPPALYCPVGQHGTRVVVSENNARRRCDARNLDGGGAVGRGTIPKLTIVIISPALDLTVCQHSTRVRATYIDALRRRDV